MRTDSNHYKGTGVEPVEFISSNNMGFAAGNVVKYVFRHAEKDGPRDLGKAADYLNILCEDCYGVTAAEVLDERNWRVKEGGIKVKVDEANPKIHVKNLSSNEVISVPASVYQSVGTLLYMDEGYAITHLAQSIITTPRYKQCNRVVSVGRGGAWAAAQVAYILDAELSIFPDNKKMLDAMKGDSLEQIQRTLYVDDIADTGTTITNVLSRWPEMKIATLFCNEACQGVMHGLDVVWGAVIEVPEHKNFPISQLCDVVNVTGQCNEIAGWYETPLCMSAFETPTAEEEMEASNDTTNV